MNILTQPQLLAALAERCICISRQLVNQSLHPVMEADGFAQKLGDGKTSMWVYDGAMLWRWVEYLQKRQALIACGKWSTKRPYSLGDLLDLVDEGMYDEFLDRLAE
jgi:hypothetical protein